MGYDAVQHGKNTPIYRRIVFLLCVFIHLRKMEAKDLPQGWNLTAK